MAHYFVRGFTPLKLAISINPGLPGKFKIKELDVSEKTHGIKPPKRLRLGNQFNGCVTIVTDCNKQEDN